jgi:hypothetical protein
LASLKVGYLGGKGFYLSNKPLNISGHFGSSITFKEKKIRVKGQSWTRPGTLLKYQIPIRTFSDWDDNWPDFSKISLTGHDGRSVQGGVSL